MFVTSHKSCQTQVHLIYHILSYLTYPSSLPTVCIFTLFSHFNLCVCVRGCICLRIRWNPVNNTLACPQAFDVRESIRALKLEMLFELHTQKRKLPASSGGQPTVYRIYRIKSCLLHGILAPFFHIAPLPPTHPHPSQRIVTEHQIAKMSLTKCIPTLQHREHS